MDSLRDHQTRELNDIHEEQAGEQQLRANYPRWRALLQTRWQKEPLQIDYQLRYWLALRERTSNPTMIGKFDATLRHINLPAALTMYSIASHQSHWSMSTSILISAPTILSVVTCMPNGVINDECNAGSRRR